MKWQVIVALVLMPLGLLFMNGCGEASWDITNRNTQVSDERPIVALGDSLTEGVGTSGGGDYPAQLGKMLGVKVINKGVSGNTTSDAMRRYEADVLSLSPAIVIIGLGGNDARQGVSKDQTFKQLTAIIDGVQAQGGMVVLLSFRFPLKTGYEKRYRELAEEKGCALVRGTMDGIWNYLGDNQEYLSDDIHPNSKGYALMAERIAPVVRDLMTQP